MTTSHRAATTEHVSPSSQCHDTGARCGWPQWRLRCTCTSNVRAQVIAAGTTPDQRCLVPCGLVQWSQAAPQEYRGNAEGLPLKDQTQVLGGSERRRAGPRPRTPPPNPLAFAAVGEAVECSAHASILMGRCYNEGGGCVVYLPVGLRT